MAVRNVGIDLSITGMHRAEAIDERGERCGHLSFRTTPEGLAALANLCFRDGSTPTVVLEPTGLAWFPLALFLRARCPEAVLVRAKQQKVSALRRVLREHAKSDRIDALTLARLPWVDPEHLEPLALAGTDMHRLDRLTRRRDRLAAGVGHRKTRIASLLQGVFPGLWECFEDNFNPRARWVYRRQMNPFRLSKLSVSRMEDTFRRLTPKATSAVIQRESTSVLATAKRLAEVYRPARQAGLVTDASFETWQQEISMELDLIEAEETQIAKLEEEIGPLYRQLDPQSYLRTIPGMGRRVAPLLLAAVGDATRFRNAKAFCQWTGVLPRSHQSSRTQFLGMRMSKAGPGRVKRALYQAAEYARRWDPQLAAIYYRQMVDYGKTHKQAMGAVMSHLAVRVCTVLREQRPYELRDLQGQPLTRLEAGRLINERFRVPEEVRRLRRHHHRPVKRSIREEALHAVMGRWDDATTHEAAKAPQRGKPVPIRPESEDSTMCELPQPVGHMS